MHGEEEQVAPGEVERLSCRPWCGRSPGDFGQVPTSWPPETLAERSLAWLPAGSLPHQMEGCHCKSAMGPKQGRTWGFQAGGTAEGGTEPEVAWVCGTDGSVGLPGRTSDVHLTLLTSCPFPRTLGGRATSPSPASTSPPCPCHISDVPQP